MDDCKLLEALSAARRGGAVDWDEPLGDKQWAELFGLARIHNVQPLVYGAVSGCASFAAVPDGVRAAERREAITAVALQARRSSALARLCSALNAVGIEPVILKGHVCRKLYPQPDCRPSSDEDLYIERESFAVCADVLQTLGYASPDKDDPLEQSFFSEKDGMLVELHMELFPPIPGKDLNALFDGALTRSLSEDGGGFRYRALGRTDEMLYLICHAYKHFLHSGFGIRQVCDMAVFAEKYGADIDWQRLMSCCAGVRAGDFALALLDIGAKRLDFNWREAGIPESWAERGVSGDALLEDILQAGVFGGSSLSRKHSSAYTLDSASGGSGLVKSLFPPAESLKERYSFLKTSPALLPAAWAARLASYAAETVSRRDSSAADSISIGRRRRELLRRYNIID